MLKQKIDTAALFAQKKTEVQSSARTLLILDGQENAYISADELTEELLAIPEEGAISPPAPTDCFLCSMAAVTV